MPAKKRGAFFRRACYTEKRKSDLEVLSLSKFIEIDPLEIEGNVFRMIGRDWMLITAGRPEKFNTMTASWGGLGCIWNAPTAAALVRPSRYTYTFMEQEKYFSLSFLDNGFRRALQICGSVSGRDTDKVADAGLTPLFDASAPYFQQARLVLVCRKMYTGDISPDRFLDSTLASHYANGDYHRLYLGEIVKVLQQTE